MFLQELATGGDAGNNRKTLAGFIGDNVLSLRKEAIRQAAADVNMVEHRLEYIATVRGIEFINDSKSTTVNQTWYSLQAVNKKIVLIFGGVDKGKDYSSLIDIVKKKVTAIVVIASARKAVEKITGILAMKQLLMQQIWMRPLCWPIHWQRRIRPSYFLPGPPVSTGSGTSSTAAGGSRLQ
ncbi:MAG: hypothetical protein JKY23_06550 [Nitrospinaceae bacterium]|nr:hypothetical protein [Nitrospinaceae bacterium]